MDSKTVNLVIDVQDGRLGPPPYAEKTPEEKAYRASVRESVEALRKQGIPTIWVSIGDDARLYPGGEPRSAETLRRLDLAEVAPRADETIFHKRFKDAFTGIEDARKSPVMAHYLAGERPDNADYLRAQLAMPSREPTLTDHLKALGVEHVTIMGGMATHCVTGTAMGAALKGFDCTIVSDRVMGWSNGSGAGWNDKTNPDRPKALRLEPAQCEAQVRGELAEVKASPARRGLLPSGLAALEKVAFAAFADLLAGSAPKAIVSHTAQAEIAAASLAGARAVSLGVTVKAGRLKPRVASVAHLKPPKVSAAIS